LGPSSRSSATSAPPPAETRADTPVLSLPPRLLSTAHAAQRQGVNETGSSPDVEQSARVGSSAWSTGYRRWLHTSKGRLLGTCSSFVVTLIASNKGVPT